MAAPEAYYTGMARTYRNEPHSYYRHEGSAARQITRRRNRAQIRNAIRNGNVDTLPRHRGTEGRITH